MIERRQALLNAARGSFPRQAYITERVLKRLSGSRSLLATHFSSALAPLGLEHKQLPQRLQAVIRSGRICPESTIGVYSSDAACYQEFAPLFNPIIRDYHGVDLGAPCSDMDAPKLALPAVVPGVISSRVRCAGLDRCAHRRR